MSYPHIRQLGHKDNHGIFDGPIVAQEKIDGSQFRFGKFAGTVKFWSRGGEKTDDTDGLFGPSMRAVREREHLLVDGWVYCGEAMCRPKHNILAYGRVPAGNVVLFDIVQRVVLFDNVVQPAALPGQGELPAQQERDLQTWLDPQMVREEAHRLGFEPVPEVFAGELEHSGPLQELLSTQRSCLGGMMEGVVVKNYARGQFAKLLNPQFQEVKGAPKVKRAKGAGLDGALETLGNRVVTAARLHKAYQHLRDEGKIVGGPEDIGPLIKELQADILEECVDFLRDELWELAKKPLLARAAPLTAEWYKMRLAQEGGASDPTAYEAKNGPQEVSDDG